MKQIPMKQILQPHLTVIATVLNEEQSLAALLNALRTQTYAPAEVVIVDGGSTDETFTVLTRYQQQHPHFPLRIFQKKGNRSVGRNTAMARARHGLIAITDAGCVPHRDWVEQLMKKYQEYEKYYRPSNDQIVIAGYYDARSTAHSASYPATHVASRPSTHSISPFQEATTPYFLVMPDRIHPQASRSNPPTFLPASRSMLLPKKVWQVSGGFDEQLSDNEDYAFAHKLLDMKIPIIFAENAKVTWAPPSSLPHFSRTIFRFARGDIASGIVRPKVVLLFGRYMLFAALIVFIVVCTKTCTTWCIFDDSQKRLPPFCTQNENTSYISMLVTNELVMWLVTGLMIVYLLWSITKNKRYTPRGWYYLPLLQLTADAMVIIGSLAGVAQWLKRK